MAFNVESTLQSHSTHSSPTEVLALLRVRFLIFCGPQLMCSIVERWKQLQKERKQRTLVRAYFLWIWEGKMFCNHIKWRIFVVCLDLGREQNTGFSVINVPSRILLPLSLSLQLPLFPPRSTPIHHHLLFSLLYLSQSVILKTFHSAVCHKDSDLYMSTERDCPKMAVAQKPPGSVLKYRHSTECWRGTCCCETPTELADASASKRMLES